MPATLCDELIAFRPAWEHSGPGAEHGDVDGALVQRVASAVGPAIAAATGQPPHDLYGHLKRFTQPCPVHCDGAGQDFTYLIPLQASGASIEDMATVVFTQGWPGGPAIFERDPPTVLDNYAGSEPVAASRMRDELLRASPDSPPPEGLSHIERAVLECLTVDTVFRWRRGRVLVFPRDRLHVSAPFEATSKLLFQGGGRLG